MASRASHEAQDRPASRDRRSSVDQEDEASKSLPGPSGSKEGTAESEEEDETDAAKLGGETNDSENAPDDDGTAQKAAGDANTIAGPSGEAKEATGTASTHGWQAIWSPPHHQYYFWNAHSGETTWVNPLESTAGSFSGDAASGSASAATTHGEVDPATTVQGSPSESQELDPELAFLDPGLYASSRAGGVSSSYASRGTFDRRTGRFVPHGVAPASDANVAHTGDAEDRHSQSAKAQRQMNAYFDVDEWQKQREDQHQQQAGSKKTKSSRHPTKRELEMYKEKKKEKKASQLGWLRG